MKLSKQEIGKTLKMLRERNGYTQKQVAQHFGRTQQVIGHWETGYSQPDAGMLFELCDYYEADISEEFGFSKKSRVKSDSWYDVDISTSERAIITAYRSASDDDRAIVNAALRKYMDCQDEVKSEKMA